MTKLSLFALVSLALICSSCQKEPLKFNSASTSLDSIPSGFTAGDIYISEEGRRAAAVVMKDGKEAILFNGQPGNYYDNVRNAVFAKGTRGYAYIARKNGKECVVADGRELPYFEAIESLAITVTGRQLYVAKNGNKWFIVSGKKSTAPLDSIPELSLSPDGSRFAYVEQTSTSKKQFVKVCSSDLKSCSSSKEFDSVMLLNHDSTWSKLLGIAGLNGKMSCITIDTGSSDLTVNEGQWCDNVLSAGISPNGRHIAYLGQREGKVFLSKDGTEQETTPLSVSFGLVVANNGRTLYSGLLNNAVVASIDGKILNKSYESINFLTFSNDGNNYVFEATKNNQSTLVANGAEVAVFDKIVHPRFSHDGSRLVYRARDKGARFVVSADNLGKKLKSHPHYDAIWDVAFSPDGKSVGYGILTGSQIWWKVEKL